MHRLFREALDEATGVSESVIVVLIDVREFSAFSMGCDSVDAAMFLKRAYMKFIDLYFPFASFYKSTGDGLLLIVPIGGKKLKEISQEVVASCIKCHSEFGNICDDDPMINFKVPNKIGIGITRGTACCLVSGEKIIDYSGRWLNLASRLMDLARPSGIVIDGGFNIGLLTEEQQAIFKEDDNIYLRGIAESEPIKIYYTPEFTVISKYNKQPIAAKRWIHKEDVKPFRDFLKLGSFLYKLESEPLSPDDITVTVEYPPVRKGESMKSIVKVHEFDDFVYKIQAGTPFIQMNFPELCRRLKQRQVKMNMNIRVNIDYVEK